MAKTRRKVAKHHLLATLAGWAVACALILGSYWVHSRHAREEAAAAADGRVAALEVELGDVQARLEHDRDAEGFFRRHLWWDSDLVQADRVDFQNVESQWERAQEEACRVRGEKDCAVTRTDSSDRASVVMHRLVVVSALTVVLAICAIVSLLLSYPGIITVVFGPIILVLLAGWWVFH